MAIPCLRSLRTLAVLALVADLGCSSGTLGSGGTGGGSGTGGAGGAATIADPAACGCHLDGPPPTAVLTISWDCFCKTYGCTQPMPQSCGAWGGWVRGCGLSEYEVSTGYLGGRQAYDQAGQLVGAQYSTDTDTYVCPTDPSMRSYAVQAGTLLDNCSSTTMCKCNADAGTCDPTDAGF